MKKILTYMIIAVLLGIITIMAPFGLFAGKIDETYEGVYPASVEKYPELIEKTRTFSADTEKQYAISPLTPPLDFLFIAFMLTLSLVIALGVMRYFRRKTIF